MPPTFHISQFIRSTGLPIQKITTQKTKSKKAHYTRTTYMLENITNRYQYVSVNIFSESLLFKPDTFKRSIYDKQSYLERAFVWIDIAAFFENHSIRYNENLTQLGKGALAYLLAKIHTDPKMLFGPHIIFEFLRKKMMQKKGISFAQKNNFKYPAYGSTILYREHLKEIYKYIFTHVFYEIDHKSLNSEIKNQFNKTLKGTWLFALIQASYQDLSVEMRKLYRVFYIKQKLEKKPLNRAHLQSLKSQFQINSNKQQLPPNVFLAQSTIDKVMRWLSQKKKSTEAQGFYVTAATLYDHLAFEIIDPVLPRDTQSKFNKRHSLNEQHARSQFSDGILDMGTEVMFLVLESVFGKDISFSDVLNQIQKNPQKLTVLLGIASGFVGFLASQGDEISLPPIKVNISDRVGIGVELNYLRGESAHEAKNPFPTLVFLEFKW